MNYILDIQVVTDLAAEPVTTAEAKAWMKVTFADDDSIIAGLITTARKVLESFTGMSFGEKIFKAMMEVNDPWVDLPYGPVVLINGVLRIDGIGSTTAVIIGTDYELINRRLRMNQCGTFQIDYKTAATVPADLKTDIMKLVAYMYQNRGIQFESEDEIKKFPEWSALSAHYYAKVVI